MSNLTNTTSHFSITEKVQYALKTALFRTMQTAFGDSGSSEKAAPPRIFPKDIMKVNLVDIGKGDIDEDGYFVSRAMGAGYQWNGTNTLVDLEAVELIVAKYRIINPSNNVITSITVENLAGDYAGKTQAQINALPTSGQTYPWKDWFFRGHYTGANDAAKFANANTTYDGLQLAWDKATAGNVATEADIVPHLKYYLQVQTDYVYFSHSDSPDNITYIHDKMKGLIGLDQNFTTTISVNRGEGGGCENLGTTGTSAGEYWFTQATSGTLAFYGVGNSGTDLVNNSNGLNGLSTTQFPMISFIRYVGETGFGAGSGGGGGAAADPEQAVTEEPSWSNTNLKTIFDGNVGIGTTNPLAKLNVVGNVVFGTYGPSSIITHTDAQLILHGTHNAEYNTNNKVKLLFAGANNDGGAPYDMMSEDENGFETFWLKGPTSDGGTDGVLYMKGRIGIGTSSPDCKLDVNGQIRGGYNSDTLSYFGRTWVGVVGGLTDHAGIGHIDHIGNGEYALMQANNGKTYLGSVSGQSIGFRIGNSDKMELNSSGQLKVGYNTNTYCFLGRAFVGYNGHNDNAGFGHLDMASTVNYGFAQNSSGQTYVNCKSGTGIRFRISNSDKMCMDSNGNFGIGTTDPGAKLEVNGRIGCGGWSSDGNDSAFCIGNDTNWGMKFVKSGSTYYNRIGILGTGNDTRGIQFYDNNGGHTRMFISGNGNVGINMDSPYFRLHISGSGQNWNTSPGIGFGDTHNNKHWYVGTANNSTAGDFYIRTCASNSTYPLTPTGLTIQHGGNVGIGTTSPDEKLHINGGKLLITDGNGQPGGKILGGVDDGAHAIHFRVGEDGATDVLDFHEYGKIRFYTGGLLANQTERMCILSDGNVGIGTTSPAQKIDLGTSGGNIRMSGISATDQAPACSIGRFYSSNNNLYGGITFGNIGNVQDYISFTTHQSGVSVGERMRIDYTGNVGIGTTSPVVKLHVAPSPAFTSPSTFGGDGTYISDVTHKKGGSYSAYFAGHSTGGSPPYYSGWAGDYDPGDYTSANVTSAYFEAGIMVGGRVWLESDERIKHGIEVINDSFALRTIREIECYTYFYNDMIRRTPEITLGFLAQEVKEKFPMAVKMKQDFLPVAMTFAQDIIWEEIIDNSKNKFKLTIPILHKDASNNIVEHEPGTKFKFYLTDVSNNINNQDFCVSTLLEDGKSFILEKKSKYVFIYGYLVDDFHILDKEKIFTLHHSAIQEIDKIQQADKAEIAELKTEVATLKSELEAIKQHLGI